MKKPNPEKPPADILSRLTNIYRKFTRARRINPDSQMCNYWEDPTVDVLVGSHELYTIETEFGIEFDDDSAMELYDMTLAEAAVHIGKMVNEQNAHNHNPDDFVIGMSPEMAKLIVGKLWKNNENLRPAIILAEAEIEFEKGRK